MREALTCRICEHTTSAPAAQELGEIRGNTARFKDEVFTLWRCPRCGSIHHVGATDLKDIYSGYALNKRRLDLFARATLHNLKRRLEQAGLAKGDRILDYGCGNGLFIRYLAANGYASVQGFDPFVDDYAAPPTGRDVFDAVVANDVIEHVEDPKAMLLDCRRMLRPDGLLYLGTADAEGVAMNALDPHLTRLHQPFHRVIISRARLPALVADAGFSIVATYRRSYMDTLLPFCNYRFLDELCRESGDLDRALDPDSAMTILRNPRLLFYAFLGFFLPSADEPAVVARRLEA